MPERPDLFVGSLTDATRKYLGEEFALPPPQPPVDDGRPLLHGFGPVEFSTCMALSVSPEVCWDVNRYYRELGVHWKADRKELMRAYQSFGSMPSARVTYVFKQLLNPVIRREYDRVPLGGLFLDDYVREAIQREATKRAAAKTAAGQETTAEQILDEMGLKLLPDEDDELLDDEVVGEEDVRALDEGNTDIWPWSFYLWRTKQIDEGRLRQWQEMLSVAFGTRGVIVRLAVGLHGSSVHPWVIAAVGYRTVVFLHRDHQPTVEAANAVVDRVVQDRAIAERKAVS